MHRAVRAASCGRRPTGGEAVNHKRVARIMRALGIEGVRLRRRHRTTITDRPPP
ncbi:IS3 family transposase, partial [Streptomyces sp. NPDC014623]|uniref:IS3 family transposase n=1 Tax=Streptomyces sp. NPDC014623 TaxID=3364875 RepID=UPI0037028680